LFLASTVTAFLLAAIERAVGIPVSWGLVAVRLAFGVAIGMAIGVAFGLTIGVAVGVAFGVAFGAAFGVAVGEGGGVAFGAALGVAFGVGGGVGGVVSGVLFGVIAGVVFGVLFGVEFGVTVGMDFGVAFGVAVGVAFPLFFVRLPTFLLEAPVTWALSALTRAGWLTPARAVEQLPFRHHDLIYFPLPGLRSLLVELGRADPDLGRGVITQAAESLGQKRPARLALAELQALSLGNAARERWFARAARLDLPFLPTEPPEDSPLRRFQAAAEDLRAYEVSRSHEHRQEMLAHAERVLEDFRINIQGKRRPELLERLLLPVARTWLELVAELRARLVDEMQRQPQVPTPFVAGPVLSADKPWLFKGRKDLVGLIDHDLSGDRRGPLLLVGQRRMGKSSLLEMLPVQLGAGTTVIKVNFQGLSGSPLRAEPHRLLVAEVAKAWPGAPTEPQAGAWGLALGWLGQVDERLGQAGTRMLVAIDEVERLQDGIADGWANTDFLDFVRAVGDTLRRIRLLLVSAYPLARLGPHWPDRLISALSREISYLQPEEARELIRHPTPDFPDIYPEGAVNRLVAETRGHPYLIQLVCDELCRRLNDQSRLRAESADIQAAIDAAFSKTSLFDELWRQQDDRGRTWLRVLAAEPRPVDRPDEALRRLVRTHFVQSADGKHQVAVPMFAAWIRDQKGT
jgi:hypothetical protein